MWTAATEPLSQDQICSSNGPCSVARPVFLMTPGTFADIPLGGHYDADWFENSPLGIAVVRPLDAPLPNGDKLEVAMAPLANGVELEVAITGTPATVLPYLFESGFVSLRFTSAENPAQTELGIEFDHGSDSDGDGRLRRAGGEHVRD